jgi:hypothetical protein
VKIGKLKKLTCRSGDKELVQALILDAKITKVFEEKNSRRDS